jgi:hypothetical protein
VLTEREVVTELRYLNVLCTRTFLSTSFCESDALSFTKLVEAYALET